MVVGQPARTQYGVTSVTQGTEHAEEAATCTLLGPEGSAGDGLDLRTSSRPYRGAAEGPARMTGASQAEEYRPYFENYTVDASIFGSSALERSSHQDHK